MLQNEMSLGVRGFVDTRGDRESLRGVHITPWFVEATDGMVFVRAESPTPEENCPIDGEEENFEAIIPLKSLPNPNPPENYLLRKVGNRIRISTENLGGEIVEIGKIEADYPDVSRIITRERAGDRRIVIDPHLLEKVLAYFSEHCEDGIEIYIPEDPLKSIEIRGQSRAGQKAIAIIMPMGG